MKPIQGEAVRKKPPASLLLLFASAVPAPASRLTLCATALRRGRSRRYLAGGGVLFCVEPEGAAGLVGSFDFLGFFFSLLLRS